MTDQDTMVYLRNAALALSRIAQEKGIRIGISASEGYANVRAGDYNYLYLQLGQTREKEEYEYQPFGVSTGWKKVNPDQIRFEKEPENYD